MSVALQVEENEVLEVIDFGIWQCGGHWWLGQVQSCWSGRNESVTGVISGENVGEVVMTMSMDGPQNRV